MRWLLGHTLGIFTILWFLPLRLACFITLWSAWGVARVTEPLAERCMRVADRGMRAAERCMRAAERMIDRH